MKPYLSLGLVVAVTMMLLSYAQSQSDCRFSIIALAATNTGTIDMRCPVDVDVVITEFRWKWQKITHDDRILEIITNNLMEGKDIIISVYNKTLCLAGSSMFYILLTWDLPSPSM